MMSQRHNAADLSGDALTVGREIPDEILDAVRDSVIAVGVRRTTLTDVARRAGVSRMTLYRMVPDVEALLLELLTHDFTALLVDAEQHATRKRSARTRLVAVLVSVARRLPDEPLLRRILDVDPELLLPYLTDRWGGTQRFALGHLRRAVAEGHADGSVRRGPADVMAVGLLMLITPFVVSARLLDEVGRDQALAELERGIDGWLRP